MTICPRPRCPRTFFLGGCVPHIFRLLDDASLTDVSRLLDRKQAMHNHSSYSQKPKLRSPTINRHMDRMKYASGLCSLDLTYTNRTSAPLPPVRGWFGPGGIVQEPNYLRDASSYRETVRGHLGL
jgi:hypothetical protein